MLLLSRGASQRERSHIWERNPGSGSSWSEEVAQALLAAGAQVNAQGGYHGNALQAAARNGQVCLVQMLLNAGVDGNARGGIYGDALTAATRRKNTEIFQHSFASWRKR